MLPSRLGLEISLGWWFSLFTGYAPEVVGLDSLSYVSKYILR